MKKQLDGHVLAFQRQLLKRFADWTGRKHVADRKIATTYWLNSVHAMDLGRRVPENTLWQWSRRNYMPKDARLAIEALLEQPAHKRGTELPWREQRYPEVIRPSIRLDLTNALDQKQYQELNNG